MKQGGSKIFLKRYQPNRECQNIAKLVNNRVAEFVKQQLYGGGEGGGASHLLSAKKIKKEKEKGACYIKLFQPDQLLEINI